MPNYGITPPQVEGAEIKYYNNYIYMAAGQATSSPNKYPNGFFRYNLLTSAWEDISNPENSYTSRFYTRSALFNGYFYLVYGWNYNISADIGDIMRVNLNSPTFPWENFSTTSHYTRDSFGMSINGESLYIFGGYISEKIRTVNDLIKLDLSTSTFSVLTSDGVFPSARSSPSLHLISTSLYLFAGQGDSSFLNDMWVYSISSDSWSDLNQLGEIPGARSRHAANSQGDAIAIWGGVGDSGLLGDLFIFNSLTYYWTQLLSQSAEVPVPGKGACLVMDLPDIYIFGGLASVGCLGQLWLYNIGTNQYSILSQEGPQLAYMTCQVEGGYFYALFGQDSVQQSSGAINRFDLEHMVWESMYAPSDSSNSSSQGIQMLLGDTVVRIGGEAWDLDPKKEVYVYQNAVPTLVGSIGEYVYLAGVAYYNTSFYAFGGGGAVPGGSLRLTVPSQLFIAIDMNDVCEGRCGVRCSPGTIQTGTWCEIASSGYVAQGFGNTQATACPPGTINSVHGASSMRQCYPCPQGYFTSFPGSSGCLDCPVGSYCSTGCRIPTNITLSNFSTSFQPDLYSAPDTNTITLQYEVIVGTLMAIVILVSMCWEKVSVKLKNIDLYTNMHNYELRKKMILDKNRIGGIFSLFFIALAVLLVGISSIAYDLDNIQESKALVPLVILQSEVDDFISTDFGVYTSFLTYGDSCIAGNICSPLISVYPTNMRYRSFTYVCTLSSSKTCIITVSCTSCIIDTGASISISLQEKLSYSTGIYVNISSSSSIPGTPSSVFQSLYPTPGYMFIGSTASQFYFTMTPSLFKSESSAWPVIDTGYHISTEKVSTAGSQYLSIDLPITSMLNLQINLDKSIFGLLTDRTLKQNLLFFFSSLIGSVFGLMGFVGRSMRVFEGKIMKKGSFSRKRYLNELVDNRKNMKIAIRKNKQNEDKEKLFNTGHEDLMSCSRKELICTRL